MRTIPLIAALMLMNPVILGVSPAAAAEWSTYQRDARHTADSSDVGPGANATIAWRTEAEGAVFASPVVANDTLVTGEMSGSYTSTVEGIQQRRERFVANSTGRVVARDAATGELVWARDVEGSVMATPVIDAGRVYVGTIGGEILALNMTSGDLVWRFSAEDPVFALEEAGGRLYAGTRGYDAHNLSHRAYPFYAIDTVDGSVVWLDQIREGVWAPPAIAGDTVYVGSQNGTLQALAESDGSRRWTYRTPGVSAREETLPKWVLDDPVIRYGAVASAPTVTGGTVFFGSYAGAVHAVGRERGERLWMRHTRGSIASSPAASNGTLFVSDYSGTTTAMTAASGRVLWNASTPGVTKSSPAVAGGTVYVGARSGRIHAVNATTGEDVWGYDAGDIVLASPAVVDDRLYVASIGAIAAVERGGAGRSLGSDASEGEEDDETVPTNSGGGSEDGRTDRDAGAADPLDDSIVGLLLVTLVILFGSVMVWRRLE